MKKELSFFYVRFYLCYSHVVQILFVSLTWNSSVLHALASINHATILTSVLASIYYATILTSAIANINHATILTSALANINQCSC